MPNFSNYNDSSSESCQDSSFSELYLLLLTQSAVRLPRHTHTPKCNEPAKIRANCGLKQYSLSLRFPCAAYELRQSLDLALLTNYRYFYKTHLATLISCHCHNLLRDRHATIAVRAVMFARSQLL